MICDLRVGLALALVRGGVFQAVGRGVLKATEDLEGGVALDAVGLAEVGLFCAVDLYELDILLLQGGSGLLIFWGEGLAVATPWGEDYLGCY